MRLGLYFFNHPKHTDAVWYHIGVHGNNTVRPPTPEEDVTLQQIVSRIETMARKVLGEDFKHIYKHPNCGEIEICFTKGISAGSKRFDFRSFCGWVELCAME